jgi:hypothetical protein
MRPLGLVLAASILVAVSVSSAQQPLPTVDTNLVVRGVPIGKVFEKFRPQLSAYFKEIEADGDYANYSVPPSKSFEQRGR